MNKNIRIAKQLVKIARGLVALDEESDGSAFQYIHDVETNEQDELDRAEREGKKYILYRKEHGLWRIRACKDFSDVKKGDIGGLIETEDNLSQEGNCWVYGNGEVYDHAMVFGDAKVFGGAEVHGRYAKVYGDAEIFGNANVCYVVSEGVITDWD